MAVRVKSFGQLGLSSTDVSRSMRNGAYLGAVSSLVGAPWRFAVSTAGRPNGAERPDETGCGHSDVAA